MSLTRLICWIGLVCVFTSPAWTEGTAQAALCLDGFCIGQSVQDKRFSEVEWMVPKDARLESCAGIGCQSDVAFRGYSADDQKRLQDAVSIIYGLGRYSILTKKNLEALRRYKYECNLSQRGFIGGDRRFFGAYLSAPSRYLSVVGLRLIDGELRVYRIARQYPFHTQDELIALARKLQEQYGQNLLLYDGISSNAYSDVIEQKKNAWFGRSSMFNASDLSDNTAELVLIDPKTRSLLEPSSMPESGEIKALGIRVPPQCSRPVPLQ